MTETEEERKRKRDASTMRIHDRSTKKKRKKKGPSGDFGVLTRWAEPWILLALLQVSTRQRQLPATSPLTAIYPFVTTLKLEVGVFGSFPPDLSLSPSYFEGSCLGSRVLRVLRVIQLAG